jgi:FkbM family methyltransferase
LHRLIAVLAGSDDAFSATRPVFQKGLISMSETQKSHETSLSFFQVLKRKLNTARVLTEEYRGRLTPWEFALMYVNYVILMLTHRNFGLHIHAMYKRLLRPKRKYRFQNLLKNREYVIKDVRLPPLDLHAETIFHGVFYDTFWVYTQFDDCYDEDKIGQIFELLPEGPYGLRNDLVDVTVEPEDIVIDAGSWIGDFAAYASAKGAVVYAFEPAGSTFEYLLKTAELNKNIHPVKKGLGDKKASVSFQSQDCSGGNRIVDAPVGETDQTIETTSIDAFVEENGLERVDFIKADIEGYERQMLKGASETLRRFAPRLAICTYHLPDDPEVLEALIKEANPAYNVVQKSKKLYASVPKR